MKTTVTIERCIDRQAFLIRCTYTDDTLQHFVIPHSDIVGRGNWKLQVYDNVSLKMRDGTAKALTHWREVEPILIRALNEA